MASEDQLYKRADEAFQKHNFDYAREMFLQILAINPDHAQARKALRVTIIRKFQEQGATSRIRLFSLKGQTLAQMKTTKDPKKKVEVCQKHLTEDPNNTKVRTQLAELLVDQGHAGGAAAEAEMVLESEPTNLAAAKALVKAYIHLKKAKEAQIYLDRLGGAASEDRELEKLRRDLAAMQTMSQGFEEGAGQGSEGFRKAMKNSDQAAALERKQRIIQSDADLLAEVQDLEKEMADNPTDARYPRKIGDLYFGRKNFGKAREWYKKASQLAPQDSVLRDKVDDCNLKLYELQIVAAKQKNDPKLKELQAGLVKLQIQSFERRVQDRPTDMGLRFDLGKAYYVAGPSFLDKAIGEFQQSVRDPKRKSDSHLYLGMAFQRKRMFDMAEKQYEQAETGVLSQDKKLGIQYNRAACCAESGNLPKAVEIGKQIMEVDISYKDISQLVDKWGSGGK